MFYLPFVIFEIYFKDQPVNLITTIPVSSTATLSNINSSVNCSVDPSFESKFKEKNNLMFSVNSWNFFCLISNIWSDDFG